MTFPVTGWRLFPCIPISNLAFPLWIAGFALLMQGCSKETDLPSPELQRKVAGWHGGEMSLGDWLHTFRELHSPDEVSTLTLTDNLFQLTHEAVSERLLTERAREGGMHRDPKMVDRLNDLKDDRLVVLYLRQNVDEKVIISRDDLRRHYEENQDQYLSPATYSYYRIYVSKEKYGKEEAEQRAKKAWTMLDQGANYFEVLEEYSDTRAERKNLLYGPFKAGEYASEIEKVILDTPVRRHSPVVELPDGYAILFPESKTEAIPRAYENVEKDIYQALYSRNQADRAEQLLRELDEKYDVKTNMELFDAASVNEEDILVEINPGGTIVTWGEFRQFATSRGAVSREELRTSLEQLARRMLVLTEARQVKFDETEYFRKRYRPHEMRILSDYFLQLTVDPSAEPTEEEAKKYYEDNRDSFRRPAEIEAWHLTRKLRYPMDATDRDRVVEEGKVIGQLLDIRNMIADQGDSFITWASRFTEYEDNGYLGWVPMLAMPPEWISVVASLEEGEISYPIRVSDTFELVMRGAIREPGVETFETAREKVIARTREAKLSELRAKYLEDLLAQVEVTYDIAPIQDLVARLLDRSKRPPQYWMDPYK